MYFDSNGTIYRPMRHVTRYPAISVFMIHSIMTTYRKELPAVRFLHAQKNVDTVQHRHTIMSPVGYKAAIHMGTLLS
jgi:hypothetical protein